MKQKVVIEIENDGVGKSFHESLGFAHFIKFCEVYFNAKVRFEPDNFETKKEVK